MRHTKRLRIDQVLNLFNEGHSMKHIPPNGYNKQSSKNLIIIKIQRRGQSIRLCVPFNSFAFSSTMGKLQTYHLYLYLSQVSSRTSTE